jgi:hypothetical protein
MDGQIERWTDEQIGQTDRRGKWDIQDGWADKQTYGRTDRHMDGQTDRRMDRQMNRQAAGQPDGWTYEQTGKQVDR